MGSATRVPAAPSYASPSCALTTASTGALRGRHRHSSIPLPRPAQADGCAHGRRRRTAQSSFLSHFHLTSAAGTGRRMLSRPAQAHSSAAQRSSSTHFHPTSAAGPGRQMRSRPAQAHGASSMLLPHGPKTLLPNNFHLASLVATLTPICRFLRDAWMRSRPAQARSAAQRSSFTDSSVSLPRPAQADGCARGRHRRTALLRCYSLTDQNSSYRIIFTSHLS